MLTRSTLTALAAALILSASPAAFASSTRGAKPRVKVKSRTGATTGTRPGRVQVTARASGMGRAPRTAAAATTRTPVSNRTRPAARGNRFVQHAAPKPSIAKNVGWGAFWTAIGVASVATGGAAAAGGAIIGGSAAAYNFIKAYLNNRKTTTAEQSRSVAFNAGWGTLFAGMAVQGIVTGDPLSAAIGIGAGAYNLIKASLAYKQLPKE